MRTPEKVLLVRMSMIRFEAPDQSAGRVPLSVLLDTSSSFSEGILARAAQDSRNQDWQPPLWGFQALTQHLLLTGCCTLPRLQHSSHCMHPG